MKYTRELIDLAKWLTPSGVIGDGAVAHFHELAERALAEIESMERRDEDR